MKEFTVSQDYEITVKEWFQLFLATSEYKIAFHTKRGDSDIKPTSWSLVPGTNNKYERKVKMHSPTSNNGMIKRLIGATVEVTDTETYYFASDNELLVEGVTVIAGSMSSSFYSGTKWRVISKGVGSCTCTITIQNEYKGSWLKSQIEQIISDSSVSAFQTWIEMSKSKSIEYLQEKEKQQQAEKLQASIVSPPSSEDEMIITTPRASPVEPMSDSDDSDNEEFFDAEDFPEGSPKGQSFLREVNTQLDGLRNLVEITQRRILGLESILMQIQGRGPSGASQASLQDTFRGYFQRLDDMSRERAEEHQRAKEREKTLFEKIDDLTKKVDKLNSTPGSTWMKGVAFGVFMIVWPFIATSAWKLVKAFYVQKLKRQ